MNCTNYEISAYYLRLPLNSDMSISTSSTDPKINYGVLYLNGDFESLDLYARHVIKNTDEPPTSIIVYNSNCYATIHMTERYGVFNYLD